MENNYIQFTKEMQKEYTILVPNMLPMHFELILQVMRNYGYKMELLHTDGPEIAETGLKYVHNDTCYPALLIIGQCAHFSLPSLRELQSISFHIRRSDDPNLGFQPYAGVKNSYSHVRIDQHTDS